MRICYDLRTGTGCGAINPDQAGQCRTCALPLETALRVCNVGDPVRQYRIVRVIGYGKFGAVYQAQTAADQPLTVALKETLHPGSTHLFQREFEVLRQVQHPNLPRYYEAFVEQQRGYLVMDLVPGQCLQDVLSKRNTLKPGQKEPLPESLVVGCYALQLCAALRHLHEQEPPILHRDIKPANIRITPDGLIKLVDFGLVKHAGKKTSLDIRGIGTAPYAPPEQYSSSGDHTDQRSDIYSLSATLYHLITGIAPPAASDRLHATSDPLQPPLHYVPDLSPHISDALMVGLSLLKRDRYDDIAAFKRALLDDSAINLSRTLRGHSGEVTSVDCSPDGQTVASASADWTVRLWHTSDGRLLHMLRGHSGQVNSVAYSPDGQVLVSASSGCTMRLWNASDGSLLRILQGHSQSVRSVAWSPNGKLLASGGDDHLVQIWRAADMRQLCTLRGHTETVRSVAWSPDGMLLASGSLDNTIRVWNMASGIVFQLLQGHTAGVWALAWSPNGTTLASASADGTVRLWQVANGRLLHTLCGHSDRVNSVAYSPDGQMLVSASADQTIRIWRVRDGMLLRTLPGHTGMVNDVAVGPDGRVVVSAGSDRRLRQWTIAAIREVAG